MKHLFACLLLIPVLFGGCSKSTPRSNCYEGTVVYTGPTCGGEETVIIQIKKGRTIGTDWMEHPNSVGCYNVPGPSQAVGTKLYFTLPDNKIDSTPQICLALYLGGPRVRIEPSQFLSTPCK